MNDPGMTGWHRAPAIVLCAVSVGLYATALANGFVWDDGLQVLANPWIRDLRHLGEAFTSQCWAFAGRDSNYYRPFMHTAYALVYVPFGPVPALFHAANVLLHAASTLLVFGLCRRLVPEESGTFPPAAILGALVFAAHPVHVEAVAWVAGLPDVAGATLWLAALLAFLAAWDRGAPASALHVAGAAAFLASGLFKESGATLPAAVAALDLARRGPVRSASFWVGRYGALTVATVIYAVLRVNAVGEVVPHASVSGLSLAGALDFAGVALGRYFAMLFVPYPLNAFQTMESSTVIPSWLAIVLPLALLLALAMRSVPWTVAFALFLVPIVPVLFAPALLPGLDNPWAERYLYLPSAGLAIALAILTSLVSRSRSGRRAVWIAGLPIVLLCSVMTHTRIAVWRDDLTLWRDVVSKSPGAGAAHGALGYALFQSGDVEGAMAEYRTALRLKPDHADSWTNLGVALAQKGLHGQALAAYGAAVRLQPRRGIFRADLAISLSSLGRHDEAIAESRRAVELQPDLPVAWHALGVALGNAGRIADAADAFRRAITLDPSDAGSRTALERARTLLRRG